MSVDNKCTLPGFKWGGSTKQRGYPPWKHPMFVQGYRSRNAALPGRATVFHSSEEVNEVFRAGISKRDFFWLFLSTNATEKTPPDARQDQLSGAQRYAFLPIFPTKCICSYKAKFCSCNAALVIHCSSSTVTDRRLCPKSMKYHTAQSILIF